MYPKKILNCGIVVFSLLLLVVSCSSDYLPSEFPKCYRDDPKLNECMLKAFNEMRELARFGIKEIGLPPLDKIITPTTIKGQLSMVNLTAKVSNYTVQGVDNYTIKTFEYDSEKMIIRIQAEFKSVLLSGYGSIDGNIASIFLRGFGSFCADIGPIKSTIEIKGKLKRSREIDFYDTKDVSVNLNIEDGIYHMDGYFDNNDNLNNLVNQMFKENSKLVTNAGTPVFERLAEAGVRRFMKRLTKRIPYNNLLPLHSKA